MAPVVEAYQAMRGAPFLVAVTFAAEIGDVRRFDSRSRQGTTVFMCVVFILAERTQFGAGAQAS